MISEKWQNYIRYLASKTGGRIKELSIVVGVDVLDNLSTIDTDRARYVTEMLKQEVLWLDSLTRNKEFLVSETIKTCFRVVSSSGINLEAPNEDRLIKWATKRLGTPGVDKLKVFLRSKDRSVVITDYTIRKEVR